MAIYRFQSNSLDEVPSTTFQTEGILERRDLQAALKSKIDVIAPDCMVIAEEFSEWSDSQRRIDLLAVDKNANLVVIELKRNETGEHMDLQAIRYAAMVSTLTFKQATEIFGRYLADNGNEVNAEERLLEFLGWESPDEEFGLDVRIVLVSSNFSTELTTSVMWLMERDIDITCVRLIPYKSDDTVLIDVQQIIPLPEAEKYQVKIKEQAEERREARKTRKDRTQYTFQEERHNKRKLVHAELKAWFDENQPRKVSELFEAFPERVHPRGLLVPEQKALEIRDRQKIDRHFLNEDEIFEFPESGRWAATNQWDKAHIDEFIAYAANCGYEIEESGELRKKWNQDLFFQELSDKVPPEKYELIKSFHSNITKMGVYRTKWGSGIDRGSFSIVADSISDKSLFSVYTDGALRFSFHWLIHTPTQRKARDMIFDYISALSEFNLSEDQRDKKATLYNWCRDREVLEKLLLKIKREFCEAS